MDSGRSEVERDRDPASVMAVADELPDADRQAEVSVTPLAAEAPAGHQDRSDPVLDLCRPGCNRRNRQRRRSSCLQRLILTVDGPEIGLCDPRDTSAAVVRALRRAADRGARVASVCVGAFALAAAGLLDGRAATTHWEFADELAERFPQVRVRPEVLYIDEGQVLTSAGIAAGIDLCLHLVRTDHGAAAASEVSRRLVAAMHRPGGQAQFMHRPHSGGRTGPLPTPVHGL